MKIRDYIGRFANYNICEHCGWYPDKIYHYGGMPCPPRDRSICPDCGEHTVYRVGRFHMREKKGFWYGYSDERVKFYPKGSDITTFALDRWLS